MVSEAVIIVQGLGKRYDEKMVLKNIDLVVNKGETVSLLGPNGAGKTTLIEIIVGILKPTSGKVEVLGEDPRNPRVREKIAYCPQEDGLIDLLTGMENIIYYSRLYGLDPGRAKDRIKELLEWTGLWEDRGKRVSKYSGGMRKKLSIAISLIKDPEILVLDEPTAGLDPDARRQVIDFLAELRRKGKTILLSTHYTVEAEKLSDRVYIIDDGKILAKGTPSQLISRYAPESVVKLRGTGLSSSNIEEIASKLSLHARIEGATVYFYTLSPERDVPRIVLEIYGKDGEISALEVEKPGLDDVFMKLANKRLGR